MTKLHHLPPHLFSRMRPAGVRGLLFGLLLALACGLGVNQTAARPLSHQAGLVVQVGDNQPQTYCVNFDSDTISGLQLLQNVSSLQVIYDATSTGMGAGVCKINNDGCSFPIEDCFCQCQGLACVYWSYWHLQPNNTWDYSSLGASSFVLTDGQVDGWRWGAGTTNSAQPPPVITLAEICQPAPTATPTLTPTPLPTATPTPAPTATSTPTLTPVVQISFSAAPTALAPGQCSSVAWKVTGPWTAIYYQEAIVTPEEQRQECPQQTQTLRLRVETGGGALTRSITLQVTGAGVTATPTPLASPAQTATPTRMAPAQTTPTSTPTSTPAAASPTATPAATSAAAPIMTPPPSVRPTPSTPAVLQNEPTATPTKAAGTAAPQAASPNSPGGGLFWQYALFGLILLALGGVVIFVLGRQARMEDEE